MLLHLSELCLHVRLRCWPVLWLLHELLLLRLTKSGSPSSARAMAEPD